MSDQPHSLCDHADLRAKAEAWRTEITTPGHYGTEAFHELEDALLGDGPDLVLALVAAAELATAADLQEIRVLLHDVEMFVDERHTSKADDPNCVACGLVGRLRSMSDKLARKITRV